MRLQESYLLSHQRASHGAQFSRVSARGLTAAIRGAVHLGAVNHLKLEQTWRQPGWIFGRDEAVLILLFVLAFIAGYRKDKVGKYAGLAVTARTLIFFLSWVALMLIFLSAHPALGSYEPFAMMFSLEGLGIQWYILPASVFGSIFVPRFWCRLFCPVGLYLNEMVRLRRKIKGVFSRKAEGRA